MNSPSKSCWLDPLPTNLLKQCVDILLPVITDLVTGEYVNYQRRPGSGGISSSKKLILSHHFLKNIPRPRPAKKLPTCFFTIFYLSYGKYVAAKLSHDMQSYNLYETKQSAYRKGHSTDTALLWIQNCKQPLIITAHHAWWCLTWLQLSIQLTTTYCWLVYQITLIYVFLKWKIKQTKWTYKLLPQITVYSGNQYCLWLCLLTK